MIKRCIVVILLGVLLFSLTGCYDARGVESLSYAVAIGLDKGENNLIRLSLQFAAPSSDSSRRRYQSTI